MSRDLAAAPHHDGSSLYVSTETPALGETVRVRLRVPRSFESVARVLTRSNPDREPRFTEAQIVHRSAAATWSNMRMRCAESIVVIVVLPQPARNMAQSQGWSSMACISSSRWKSVTEAPAISSEVQ